MNIYLDVDGVLLANENHLANYANEFLLHILKSYPDTTYWLTTHCQGDAAVPLQRFEHLFEADVRELMKQIKPTKWEINKTEAIDFSQDFLWFDDDLYPEEQADLIKHNALAGHININLQANSNALKDFINL